jgi:hypothetical protein
MLRSSRVAAQLAASREGLGSMSDGLWKPILPYHLLIISKRTETLNTSHVLQAFLAKYEAHQLFEILFITSMLLWVRD